MALSHLRARVGVLVWAALVTAALLPALGCGKKPGPEPAPGGPAKTESGKSEKPKPKEEPQKKEPPPVLSDLEPVEGAEWAAPADPARPITGRFNLKDEIRVEGEVVVPATPGPFAAIGVPRAKRDTYRAYDLRNLEPVGVRVALPPFTRLALSPDGRHLAVRLEKEPGVVEVWSAQTGKRVFRHDFTADKIKPADVRLPAAGRLWVAEPGGKAQVWGVEDGKWVAELASPAPSAEQSAFSPGGRYLLTAAKDGHGLLHVHDLQSGKRIGERRFQVPDVLKGAPAGLAVSPDGEEVALLWRFAQQDGAVFGRLVCWELKSGKKLHEHPVPSFEHIDSLWRAGKPVVQVWPGRKGWMLFGFLLVDRDTGAVLRIKELPLPIDADDMQDRRFLDADHVADARQRLPRQLKVVRLPKAEIEKALKEERAKRSPE